jgi:hypothetical protein
MISTIFTLLAFSSNQINGGGRIEVRGFLRIDKVRLSRSVIGNILPKTLVGKQSSRTLISTH